MKSSGFDIENTHSQEIEKLEKLINLVMIAFVWCYIVGDYLDQHVKSIAIKKHGHRPKSVFKYGLEYISNSLLILKKKSLNAFFKVFQVYAC